MRILVIELAIPSTLEKMSRIKMYLKSSVCIKGRGTDQKCTSTQVSEHDSIDAVIDINPNYFLQDILTH